MPVSSFGNIVNKAKTAGGNGVPEGEYDFVVREAPEVDDAKQVVKVRCRIQGGPNDNAIVFRNLNFDEEKHEFVLKQAVDFVLGVGITEDEFINMGSLQEVAQAVHGAQFSAKVVKQKPKNWKEGDRVFDNLENIVPAAGGTGPGPQPPAPGQQFQQQAQPQYQQQAPPAPQGQPQYQQAPPQPVQGDPNQVWQSAPDQGQPQWPQQGQQTPAQAPQQQEYQQQAPPAPPQSQYGAPPAPPLI